MGGKSVRLGALLNFISHCGYFTARSVCTVLHFAPGSDQRVNLQRVKPGSCHFQRGSNTMPVAILTKVWIEIKIDWPSLSMESRNSFILDYLYFTLFNMIMYLYILTSDQSNHKCSNLWRNQSPPESKSPFIYCPNKIEQTMKKKLEIVVSQLGTLVIVSQSLR